MFNEQDGAAGTAIAFTDQVVDPRLARLDALFGAGHAKTNPAAAAAHVAVCGSNLDGFMLAATSIDAALEQEMQPAPRSKGRRR